MLYFIRTHSNKWRTLFVLFSNNIYGKYSFSMNITSRHPSANWQPLVLIISWFQCFRKKRGSFCVFNRNLIFVRGGSRFLCLCEFSYITLLEFKIEENSVDLYDRIVEVEVLKQSGFMFFFCFPPSNSKKKRRFFFFLKNIYLEFFEKPHAMQISKYLFWKHNYIEPIIGRAKIIILCWSVFVFIHFLYIKSLFWKALWYCDIHTIVLIFNLIYNHFSSPFGSHNSPFLTANIIFFSLFAV